MRSIQRRSMLGPILLSVGLSLLAIVGTIGTLWAMGKIELPFLSRSRVFQPPEGTVPVLLSVKNIPAYTRITRDHFLQPNGAPKFFWVTPDEVAKRGFYTDADFNKLVGRVAAHDMREGFAFREKDFLPEGARDGIAGGTPAGKRSLTLDGTKIAGIQTFKAGDHFDLVASYLNDLPHEDTKNRPASLRIDKLPGQKKYVMSKVIVQKGVVVQPLTQRAVPKPNAALPANGKPAQVLVQEVVIAVEPDEVAAVAQAIGGATELRAVHRSGHPDESAHASLTPSMPLPPPDIVIETMHGGKREFQSFPAPEPAAQRKTPGSITPADEGSEFSSGNVGRP